MTAPSRRRPGRPRGGDGSATRLHALQAALELFAENGFRGTSIGMVAERAGLSQAGLLHHFPTKPHLLAAVLAHRDVVDEELIDHARTGWDALQSLVEVARVNTGRRELVKLYATISGEASDPGHPAHRWLRDHLAKVTDDVVRALRSGQAEGTVRLDMPVTAVARSVVAVMDGLQIQWLSEPETVDMATDLETFLESLRARWAVAPG